MSNFLNTKMKLSILFLCISVTLSCQNKVKHGLTKINEFPSVLDEVSGIIASTPTSLYAINDSGNENMVFQLDQQGNIINTIKIPDSKNVDWEDLAHDQQGNIFIGDFGNNENDRKKLVIYKVSDILEDVIQVSKIKFSFEDQKKFPPKKKNLNFDTEAMVYYKEHLYLFTKNRSKGVKGITKVYKVPSKPGKHIAQLIGSIEICNSAKNCMITAATIDNSGNRIALLTRDHVYLLGDIAKNGIANATVKKIKLHHNSQKEGICFKNDTTLLITDEKTGKKKATLYEYSLK